MSRFVLPVAASTVLVGSISIATVLTGPSSVAGPTPYGYCPAARHLIGSSTSWRKHSLAPGVSLAEAKVDDDRQPLKVRVVRVNLGRPTTAVAPLHHALTSRHRLTKLAKRPHLVAATNGMYFNVDLGAPTVPFIGRGGPLVLSRTHAEVAGISVNGRAQDGRAWLVGHVDSVAGRHRLGAVNDVIPPSGLSVYTPTWGAAKVPLPLFAKSQAIRAGHLVGPAARRRRVPRHGELLIATSAAAVKWLDALRSGSPVSVAYHAKTNAPHRFSQAYGVGTQVVASAHHIKGGLYCRRSEIYAARTDIAWSDHGRRLILATVVSPRGSERAGVDENQMSQIMVKLGANRSYALDGGGSTELVARLPHQHKLSIRTWRHGYRERAIPVGVGVYSLPKSEVATKHQPHHKHHKKHPKKGGLGGLLPPVVP
jgi:hypothetical protein